MRTHIVLIVIAMIAFLILALLFNFLFVLIGLGGNTGILISLTAAFSIVLVSILYYDSIQK